MWNLPEHNLPSREQKNSGMSSILAWGKSRVGLPPPFIARITKQPHCGHKWPQWPRSTDWSEADDDITTCNFALKCLIPKLLRVTVLLRHYAITARYFTHLSYWHQSYCKSKCFIFIMLLRQGTLLFFLIGIKATVKASVLFLLRCYTITARYSTLLIGNKATVNASVSFVLHYDAITARYFTLLSYWHQSYCKSKCFILIRLCCYGKVLHSSYWHQSNCKCKCFILITLLRYYLQATSFFFLFSIKRLWFPSYGSFCKRRSRWQPFVSVFVVSFRFWTCFIS